MAQEDGCGLCTDEAAGLEDAGGCVGAGGMDAGAFAEALVEIAMFIPGGPGQADGEAGGWRCGDAEAY